MPRPKLDSIGARVRWLREQKNMSQASLARALGIKPPSLSEIELNKTKSPSASTLLKIAAILDANPDWIINGRGTHTLQSSDSDVDAQMSMVFGQLTTEQKHTLLAVAKSLKP
jgi:transcriptional regulator with XRE-family HTH domain